MKHVSIEIKKNQEKISMLDLEQVVHWQLAQLPPGAGQTELGQGKLGILNLQQRHHKDDICYMLLRARWT